MKLAAKAYLHGPLRRALKCQSPGRQGRRIPMSREEELLSFVSSVSTQMLERHPKGESLMKRVKKAFGVLMLAASVAFAQAQSQAGGSISTPSKTRHKSQ